MIYDAIKGTLLKLLRAPSRLPEPPPGSQGAVEIFRAAPAFLKLRVILWVGSMASAIIGEIVGLYFFKFFEQWVGAMVVWALLALTLLGLLAKYFLIRVDYDMRFYVVGERSLRIREGALTIHEITLTYANVQNLSIRQGPLERLLGIANLVVETAGGAGSGGHHDRDASSGGHEGVLRGVANASAVRDRIQSHSRQFRDAGLGDPEDRAAVGPGAAAGRRALARGLSPVAIERLREIRDELRALRQE